MQDVEEFRAEVRTWLADNLVGEFAALRGLGGPGREHEAFEERRAWNKHLSAAGLTRLGWPGEHGGRRRFPPRPGGVYAGDARGRRPGQGYHYRGGSAGAPAMPV